MMNNNFNQNAMIKWSSNWAIVSPCTNELHLLHSVTRASPIVALIARFICCLVARFAPPRPRAPHPHDEGRESMKCDTQ